MSFPVVYDANVLYPPTLRHVLIQIAQTGLVHARWTDEILDEVFRNVSSNNPHIPTDRLARTRELMCEAVADCLITGYEPIHDAQGNIVGVYYVGYSLKALSTLSNAIEERGILGAGFFALLDHSDQIIFQSQNTSRPGDVAAVVADAASGKPARKNWYVSIETYQPWDYDVVAALYLPDVFAKTVQIIREVYGIGSAIVIIILLYVTGIF